MDTTLTRMTTLWIARNRADGSKKNILFLPRDAPAFARSPWLAPWPRALSQSGTQCAPRPDLTLHSRRLGGCRLTATALTRSQLSQRMLPPPGGNRVGRPSAHLPRCQLGKAACSPCSHWKKTVQQRPWPSSFQNTGLLSLFQLFSAQTGLRARGKRGAWGLSSPDGLLLFGDRPASQPVALPRSPASGTIGRAAFGATSLANASHRHPFPPHVLCLSSSRPLVVYWFFYPMLLRFK